MRHWDEVETFFLESARGDLERDGDVAPCLVAFSGEDPLLLAYLRPFDKGEYTDPLIELIALAGPLGADRLAACFGARGWSLDGPPHEVRSDRDPRQRVLAIQGADGSAGAARPFGTLWPFDLDGGEVRWGEALRTDDPQGWIPQALTAAVAGRERLQASAEEMAAQAVRCAELGHDLYLAPEGERRLGGQGRGICSEPEGVA